MPSTGLLSQWEASLTPDTTTTTLMTKTLLVQDPACKIEQAIDSYQSEEKGLLRLSFTEKPMKRQDPYAVLWRLQRKMEELIKAADDRESSTFKRKLFELSTYASRANIESIDLETGDLL